jgi:hypothetical protein
MREKPNAAQMKAQSLESVPPEGEHPVESSSAQVFRREGDYWTVMYAGTTVRLRDAIGMRYLAYLLAQPNEPIAVTALLAAVKGGSADADPERARSAVGKRIHDSLRRIDQHHLILGHHLKAGIKTGAYCVYLPDPARPFPWVT